MADKVQRSSNQINLEDPAVFEELYALYSKKIYRFAVSYSGDTELARDIVQDVFTSVWERRKQLVIEGPVEHYLIRAAKLKIFQAIRSQEVRQRHQDNLAKPLSENTTSDDVLFDELQENHAKRVHTLSLRKQEIYKLSLEDGLSNKEISGRLAISEKTVEYHISNTVRFLKKFLLPGD